EENGAFRFGGIGREGVGEFDDADGAGAVVVSTMPDVEMVLAVLLLDLGCAVVIVVAADDEGFGSERRVAAGQQPRYVVGGVGTWVAFGAGIRRTAMSPCLCAFRSLTRLVA